MLILFSIAGAFMGAEYAKMFFNSPPLAIFWFFLAGLFAAGFVFWKSLIRRPCLLMCHAGCLAVLLGGLWGAPATHRLREALGAEPKAIKGMITLRQGQSSRQVILDDRSHSVFELPFTVHLPETGVTHYDDPTLGIYGRDGKLIARIPTIPDQEYTLPTQDDVGVRLERRFENLRLERDEGGVVGVEGDPDRRNPGYEVHFTMPDGSMTRQFVFERLEPHGMQHQLFLARYLPPFIVREYKSLLKIEKDGRVVRQKHIRVNDPLYYGGYHFYQATFGQDDIGPYSGIMVVSDSGVWMVFFGYALLTVGLFGQFWLLPLKRRKTKREAG